MLQFWSLWDEPQGEVAARSAVDGVLSCHAVLGGGLVKQGRPWTDEQTAGVMELFHRQREALPSFGRWVNAVRPHAESIRYPDQLVFMPVRRLNTKSCIGGYPDRARCSEAAEPELSPRRLQGNLPRNLSVRGIGWPTRPM